MKKFLFFTCAVMLCGSLFAATQGIYCKMEQGWWKTDGAAVGCHSWGTPGPGTSWPGVRMTPVAGQTDLWYVELDVAKVQNVIFTRVNPSGAIADWGAKTKDLTIPADGKNLFTITSSSAVWGDPGCDGTWSMYDGPAPEPEKVCFGIVKGDGTYIAGKLNADYTGEGVEYMMLNVPFEAGETFQLRDSCNDGNWVEPLDAASTLCVELGEKAYTVTEAGTYDIYLKMIGFENNIVYVGGGSCSKHGAVPSQCHDVLLQGFYFDSYEVDTAHAGTELYGDTRWTTLEKQVGEIGAYFDLIWLPPSALAAGTGYHPRQFSNQNSDWGTRAELQNLIHSFHNVGTKVVADIVINHIEAMASWCDFSVQNFGEYGLFEPDGSWICKYDEMNWENDPDPEKRQWKDEAGECWGTATGNPDDGENWEGARDWSHDMPKVQEMFKAYLRWMKDVIGYDGWRYDKGDGYNNWHMWNYNRASMPDIAFMECWKGNNELKQRIEDSKRDVMAFDFQNQYLVFKNGGIQDGNFGKCGVNDKADWGDGAGLVQEGYKKYAVTFVDNHDMFLRNDQEFCGNGNSMKPANKNKLLQANAYLLSMPGMPCIFYPHWYQYKAEIRDMINARRVAGVHSESEVREEEFSDYDNFNASGYKATVVGTNGLLIITLGKKTIQEATGSNIWLAENGYKKMAYGEGYAIWVKADNDVAPRIIATPECSFEDSVAGIKVGLSAVGGSGEGVIYYATDPAVSEENFEIYSDSLTFTKTTVLRTYVKYGTAQSPVYSFTYTYREPLKRGIQVHFQKPDIWEEAYFYAWVPGIDSTGQPTSENIMGAYPGQRIYRDMDGWYSYEFDQSLDSVHFCISSGDKCGALNVRSNDLVVDYDSYFTWEAGFEEDDKHELKLDEPIDLDPDFSIEISPASGNFRDLAEGQKVTLSVVGRKGATIYYSTDGSDPGTCANPATDSVSFVVNQTCTVQAYAFDLASKEFTDTVAETYTYKAPQQGAMTVKFFKPKDWKNVYLYAFTRVKVGTKFKDTAFPLNGEKKNAVWPGMKWTTFETKMNEKTGLLDSIYSFTMPEEMKEIYVIFNIGSNKTQTQDIYFTEDMCYVWNPDCRKAVENEDCTGYVPVPTELPFLETTEETFVNKFIMNNNLFIRVNNLIYDAFGNAIYKLKTINNNY
ncbi:MAG: alpha-amylase family glycosyl hydrolase [Paludibacteraceae bacterium]|nr:alpha-amylase family glycosyl hydrolase [Paludibacteraceae bacterium]